ncbi:MAG TPA: carbohydrate kinase family protein [Candidatus Saccharimonadales bacterium]|nr:carbohydrate kinase family protein [Candidatus Saccharimonadales bacterium]
MGTNLAETGPETKITLAGQVCIDHNDIEGRQYTDWGSAVLYMADYYRQSHGLSPAVLSSYGPDFAGYAERVSLYPETPNTNRTLIYKNVVRRGIRRQHCLNAAGEILPPIDQGAEAVLKGTDIFFLAPLTPVYHPDYVEKMLASVPEDRLKVLLPQGYLRRIAIDGMVDTREFEEATDVIPKFDLLIFSEEDVPDAVGLARAWKQQHPKTQVIVTRGPDGASIIEVDEEIHVATTPVSKDCTDTTGCGDTFSAAAAYYFTEDPTDLYKAVDKANMAARQKLLANLFGGVRS